MGKRMCRCGLSMLILILAMSYFTLTAEEVSAATILPACPSGWSPSNPTAHCKQDGSSDNANLPYWPEYGKCLKDYACITADKGVKYDIGLCCKKSGNGGETTKSVTCYRCETDKNGCNGRVNNKATKFYKRINEKYLQGVPASKSNRDACEEIEVPAGEEKWSDKKPYTSDQDGYCCDGYCGDESLQKEFEKCETYPGYACKDVYGKIDTSKTCKNCKCVPGKCGNCGECGTCSLASGICIATTAPVCSICECSDCKLKPEDGPAPEKNENGNPIKDYQCKQCANGKIVPDPKKDGSDCDLPDRTKGKCYTGECKKDGCYNKGEVSVTKNLAIKGPLSEAAEAIMKLTDEIAKDPLVKQFEKCKYPPDFKCPPAPKLKCKVSEPVFVTEANYVPVETETNEACTGSTSGSFKVSASFPDRDIKLFKNLVAELEKRKGKLKCNEGCDKKIDASIHDLKIELTDVSATIYYTISCVKSKSIEWQVVASYKGVKYCEKK